MKYCFLVCLWLLCGLAQAAEPLLQINEAWGRAMPPTLKVTALYMQLSNSSAEPVVIKQANSSSCGMLQFHQSFEEEGIMRMRMLDNLTVPAQETLSLQPNGIHIMCLNATMPLTEGSVIELTLQFVSGESQGGSVLLLAPSAIK